MMVNEEQRHEFFGVREQGGLSVVSHGVWVFVDTRGYAVLCLYATKSI
jgi:hypothetical protein